jgi:hypothetical protein
LFFKQKALKKKLLNPQERQNNFNLAQHSQPFVMSILAVQPQKFQKVIS